MPFRRVKDDERIEIIIRDLLKQPDNRRCINCNSLGPQYVCITFWTFICTSCSGVHREFNHRVKSVSMAKFNDDEISCLQAGGNERAKEIYFRTWDPQRNNYPESGNLQKIREFVNQVYVDRRYCGVKNSGKALVTSDSRSNSCDWPTAKSRWSIKDKLFRRSSFERAENATQPKKVLSLEDFLEERSPRTPQENMRSNSLRSGPTRFEIVDDRFRDDGRVKTYDRQARGGSMSPKIRTTSLPDIRPVEAILEEKSSMQRIEGPPTAESCPVVEKVDDAGGKVKENNVVTMSSLIDYFDAEPVPVSPNNIDKSISSSNKEATDVTDMNPIESLLLDWSSPVASPSANTFSHSANTLGTGASPSANTIGIEYSPSANTLGTGALPSANNSPMTAQEIQLPAIQNLVFPSANTTFKSAISAESFCNQQWNKSSPPNDLRRVQSVPNEHSSQGANPGEWPAHNTRKEIPQDLFTSNFASFTPSSAGWHMHMQMQPQPPGAMYGVQYHQPAMPAANFPNPPKPRNPFDIGDDEYQNQGPMFPSREGALATMPASTALEFQSSQYSAPSASYAQMSPYGMNMSLVPGAYMGQMALSMPPTRPQGNANFDRREDAFASLNPIQKKSGPDSLPASLPRAGNPFG